MLHIREIKVAAIIASGENGLSLETLRYLASGPIRTLVIARYNRWKRSQKRRRRSSRYSAELELARALNERMDGDDKWDGSFLEGFLTFLFENADEIMRLILLIVGMFGKEVMSYWTETDYSTQECQMAMAVISGGIDELEEVEAAFWVQTQPKTDLSALDELLAVLVV